MDMSSYSLLPLQAAKARVSEARLYALSTRHGLVCTSASMRGSDVVCARVCGLDVPN